MYTTFISPTYFTQDSKRPTRPDILSSLWLFKLFEVGQVEHQSTRWLPQQRQVPSLRCNESLSCKPKTVSIAGLGLKLYFLNIFRETIRYLLCDQCMRHLIPNQVQMEFSLFFWDVTNTNYTIRHKSKKNKLKILDIIFGG